MIPLLLSKVLSRERDRESDSDRPRRDAISFITAICMVVYSLCLMEIVDG